jgi:hypothetical protein
MPHEVTLPLPFRLARMSTRTKHKKESFGTSRETNAAPRRIASITSIRFASKRNEKANRRVIYPVAFQFTFVIKRKHRAWTRDAPLRQSLRTQLSYNCPTEEHAFCALARRIYFRHSRYLQVDTSERASERERINFSIFSPQTRTRDKDPEIFRIHEREVSRYLIKSAGSSYALRKSGRYHSIIKLPRIIITGSRRVVRNAGAEKRRNWGCRSLALRMQAALRDRIPLS